MCVFSGIHTECQRDVLPRWVPAQHSPAVCVHVFSETQKTCSSEVCIQSKFIYEALVVKVDTTWDIKIAARIKKTVHSSILNSQLWMGWSTVFIIMVSSLQSISCSFTSCYTLACSDEALSHRQQNLWPSGYHHCTHYRHLQWMVQNHVDRLTCYYVMADRKWTWYSLHPSK